MRDKIEEFLVVLANSRKTQFCLVAGILLFIACMGFGYVMTNRIELKGALSPLTETLRERAFRRYETAAWGALIGFLAAGVKCYRKDWKRLLGR